MCRDPGEHAGQWEHKHSLGVQQLDVEPGTDNQLQFKKSTMKPYICERWVQNRRPVGDAHQCAAGRWWRAARTGTLGDDSSGARDNEDRALTPLSLAVPTPFAGDGILW